MIYQTVTESDFVRAFDEANRSANFTIMARRELFDWYNELSESMDDAYELDVIGICCEWSEYTAEELIEQYGYLVDFPDGGTLDNDEFDDLVLELEDRGYLITVEHIGEDSTYLYME